MRYSQAKLVFWIIVLIPVLLWLTMIPLPLRFTAPSMIFKSLGQLLGLAGVSLFSLNLILSSRLKIFEKVLPLNEVYKKHHIVGGVALILLLSHPLFLMFNYLAFSIKSASKFIIPSLSRPDIVFGEISLGVMIILLVITFFRLFSYEIWKKLHRFLGLAFGIALVHMALVSSDISVNLFLKAYLLILASIAVVTYSYRSIFAKKFVKTTDYLLAKILKLNSNYFELIFKPKGKPIEYFPGQFVFLRLIGKGISQEEHPFSIASAPESKYLNLIIKNLGDYSGKIGMIKPGMDAKIEGPFGRFSYVFYPDNDFIFIAGGVGITPFIGMVRSLKDAKKDLKLSLFYCYSDSDELIYEKDLKEWVEKSSNFKLFLKNTHDNGRLTVEEIKKVLGSLENIRILICGPVSMMKSLKEQFIAHGVKNDNIITEEFDLD